MELACPSCGAKHQSEDYPDAFEIQCACGYSILMPEEITGISNMKQADSPNFASRASALEQEDEENVIAMDDPLAGDSLEDIPRLDDSMTPPEELPAEMPYDPFEVSGLDGQQQENSDSPPKEEESPDQAGEFEVDEPGTNAFEMGEPAGADIWQEEPQVDAAAQSAVGQPQSEDPVENLLDTPSFDEPQQEAPQEPQQSPEQDPETFESQQLEEPEEEPEEDERTPAQRVVERAQLASLGQLVGFSYNLSWDGLEREQLVELKERCKAQVAGRPWLEAELKHRKIQLDKIPEKKNLKSVPEIVALELYLACLELGGSCEFERAD